MATFTEIAQVKSFKTYKGLLKIALAKLKPGAETKFAALDKYGFDDKERALVLVDFAPDLIKALPKKPTASGKVSVSQGDKFVFDDYAVPAEKLTKLFADAGIPRAVAPPGEAPDTPSRQPEGEKLDMLYGWTEIKKWGSEAQDLIDGFDGLVGVYKGLPDIPPSWAELNTELEQIRQAIGAMLKKQIKNDHDERVKLLGEVQALTKRSRKLIVAVREKAVQIQQAKLQPRKDDKPQSPPQVAETPAPKVEQKVDKKAETQPEQKPELTDKELGSFVMKTLPMQKNDSAAKYRNRASRELPKLYREVTESMLDKLEKLATAHWFKDQQPQATTPTATPRPTVTAVPWQQRVLDLSGNQADLSSLDKTTQGKIEEIVLTGGRNDHGDTVLSGSNPACKHWAVGKGDRIFGNVVNGNFVLVGTGTHTGKGNKNYKVDLLLGGTCTATVAK